MRFTVVLSATLATLAAGAAIPAEVVERQTGTGTVTCWPAENGPIKDQVQRGSSYLGTLADANGNYCQKRTGACDRILQFGTAGFRVCNAAATTGSAPPCWPVAFLAAKFYSISTTCPSDAPSSVFGKVYGKYSVANADLPNGTIWAELQLENIPGGTEVIKG